MTRHPAVPEGDIGLAGSLVAEHGPRIGEELLLQREAVRAERRYRPAPSAAEVPASPPRSNTCPSTGDEDQHIAAPAGCGRKKRS